MPSAISHQLKLKAFTLVELLSTIAIMAVLATVLVVYIPSYVTWAKNTADKQTLSVLNDALTRYKCEGGNVNSLTLGAPIGNILTRLKTPVDWAGLQHQFLQTAFTYPARSLDAIGERSQYHFFTAGSYASEIVASETSTAKNYYPYGFGVAYMSNNNDGAGYPDLYISATNGYPGYITYMSDTGVKYTRPESEPSHTAIPEANSYTFWSSDASGNPLGTVCGIQITGGNQLVSLDVKGLTSLQNLTCGGNQLTSLNIKGITTLTSIGCYNNQLTSLDLTGLTNLTSLTCSGNQLTTLNARGSTGLQALRCDGNDITALDVTGLNSLPAVCSNWSTNFVTDPGVSVTMPNGSVVITP